MEHSNIPTVTIDQFKQIARLQYQEADHRPLFGLGKGGIGKSECIRELAAELGVGHIDIRLLTYSEVDLKGIPYPNNDNTKSIWLQNDVLPYPQRDGEKGILVLDEITSVARSVRTAAYQLLNERRLGDYVLPQGWMIICLGNGEDDGGDFQGMEGNFVNRCSVFHVVPDVDAWKAWAYAHGVHSLVLAYISWRNEELHTFSPDSETELAFASPRAWMEVSDILNRNGYNEADTITRLRILSNVGTRSGEQFWAFCKYQGSTIAPADILDGKAGPPAKTSDEILYITIQSAIRMLVRRIAADIETAGAPSAAALGASVNLFKWLLAIPNVETQTMAIKDLVAHNRDVMAELVVSDTFSQACPEFTEFAKANAAVFS